MRPACMQPRSLRDRRRLEKGAHIGPYCFVDEGVTIGERAVLHSFVTIYRGAQIGADFLRTRMRWCGKIAASGTA